MRKQSHSPDHAVIPSRSHPSVIGAEHGSTLIFLRNEGSREGCVIISGIALAFALDFQLSTVNFSPTGSLEECVIISGIAPPFALDFQLSTVNFFLSPLQSALTQIAAVTPLQSADPKTRHLKSFRMNTSKKTGEESKSGSVLLLTTHFPLLTTHSQTHRATVLKNG